MSSVTAPAASRRGAVRVRQGLAAVLGAVSLVVLSGCEPDAYSPSAVALVNRERAAAGLRPLAVSPALEVRARAWAVEMRDSWVAGGCGTRRTHLRHSPSLVVQYRPETIVGEWERLGENVGVVTVAAGDPGATARELHDAYMASPSHRANILGAWTHVGIGSVTGPTQAQLAAGACPGTPADSVMWNTQAFVK